ncbi:MAG: hypothetical protein V4485_03685, partial [Pseudomonadota bacterium]
MIKYTMMNLKERETIYTGVAAVEAGVSAGDDGRTARGEEDDRDLQASEYTEEMEQADYEEFLGEVLGESS